MTGFHVSLLEQLTVVEFLLNSKYILTIKALWKSWDGGTLKTDLL